MDFLPKEPITVVGEVPPNDSIEKTYEFRQTGEITEVWVSTYVGQEFDLQYRFEMKDLNGNWRNLLNPLEKEFLAGNGELINPEVRREFQAGNELRITVENEESEFTYHSNCMVGIDYERSGNMISEILGGVF
jgi:hypothetical protein